MAFISKYVGDINKDDEENYYVAPDTSIIRKFPDGKKGGLAHCILPARGVSKAVRHQTVEELWYCIDGQGKFWRSLDGDEEELDVYSGMYFTIPVGTHFQFKNEKDVDLTFIITTMPIWPGPSEAIQVDDHWHTKN